MHGQGVKKGNMEGGRKVEKCEGVEKGLEGGIFREEYKKDSMGVGGKQDIERH